MSTPELSVIIPAYRRVDTLRCTLPVLACAINRVHAEIIIVDDGSPEPLEPQLADYSTLPIRWLRQENQGAVVAKQNGFLQARGTHIQFLDSDDLVHPEKFQREIATLRDHDADLVYSDEGAAPLTADFAGDLPDHCRRFCAATDDPVELFLRVQPCPHNILFRRTYLDRHLRNPIIPPHRAFGSIGEVWIYFNLLPQEARIIHVPGHLAVMGESETERLTNHWERLGFASSLLMLEFLRRRPTTPQADRAARQLAAVAFHSWRRLPHGAPEDLQQRLLEVWRTGGQLRREELGGRGFQALAAILGPVTAGRILRRFQRPPYERIRTISDEEIARLAAVSIP